MILFQLNLVIKKFIFNVNYFYFCWFFFYLLRNFFRQNSTALTVIPNNGESPQDGQFRKQKKKKTAIIW